MGDDLHELDPQEGDLRLKTSDVLGLLEGQPLFRRQGFGVEAVRAGVPVAGLAASFAWGCFFLGWVLGIHGYEDSGRGGWGRGGWRGYAFTEVFAFGRALALRLGAGFAPLVEGKNLVRYWPV